MAAKVRILLLSIYFFCLKTDPANAGEIVIAGTYQGKNLYVQNPFTGNLQDFCTLDVFVNNKKLTTNLNASAFEIDLSFLQLDDEVLVKIVHKDDCKPKVLNPTVIKSTSHFHFVNLLVDEDNIIWTTSGEKQVGKFFVEQFWHNAWVILSEMDSKGGLGTNAYQMPSKHHSGINKYRIRFKDVNGHFFYSKTTEFNSNKAPVTFTPQKVSNTIILSQHTHYEILDQNGVSLLKGTGMYISVSSLKPGDYYLNVDNRTEKFSKH